MRVPDPTVDQTFAFFTALLKQMGMPSSVPYVAYASGAHLAWLEDPSRIPEYQPDTLEALQLGQHFYAPEGVPAPVLAFNRRGELQIDEIPDLYDIAREVNHKHGFPWTDPRTGVTYQPPEKK